MHSSGISIWFFHRCPAYRLRRHDSRLRPLRTYPAANGGGQLSCIGVVGRAAVRRGLVLWSPFSPQPRKLGRTAVTSPPRDKEQLKCQLNE